MSEQHLVEKWRNLPPLKQQQVLDFVESLEPTSSPTPPQPPTPIGQQLHQIRAEIVASGVPLLNWEEITQEKRDRRGERSDILK